MLIQLEESQLILVDYSADQITSIPNSTQALNAALALCEIAKLLNVPVWGAEQANSNNNNAMHVNLRTNCQKVVSKTSFDACEHGLLEFFKAPIKQAPQGNAKSLPKHLQKQEAPVEKMTLVIAGFETHLSVLQTALSLSEQEFDVCLVTDACAAVKSHNHDAALDRLAGAGVELVTLEMVVFEWLESSNHPLFEKAMQIIGR